MADTSGKFKVGDRVMFSVTRQRGEVIDYKWDRGAYRLRVKFDKYMPQWLPEAYLEKI